MAATKSQQINHAQLAQIDPPPGRINRKARTNKLNNDQSEAEGSGARVP